MKKASVVLIFLTMFAAFGAAGCGAMWWQNFTDNPTAQVQSFETSTRTALSIADVAWNTIKDFLPAATLAQVAPKYAAAELVANNALNALSDAVQVAVEAKTEDPDFSTLMQAVTDGVSSIVAIVNTFQTSSVTAQTADAGTKPAQPLGLAELNSSLATMKHIGHTK